jgi:uroporphyrinogen decarboxylase
MTGEERILCALGHKETSRIPYDLAGTTVTGITEDAYVRAMRYRGLTTAFENNYIDPVQRIVTPAGENLKFLKVDTFRIGARRIFDYPGKKEEKGRIIEVTDYYGCRWRYDPEKDLYFNQISYPLQDFASLSESLHNLFRVDWQEYIKSLRNDLDRQVKKKGDLCCIADRNIAGFTENSVRIRGYEKWFLDTLIDMPGAESLLDIILEDKMRYWDELSEWAEETGNKGKIHVISECDDLGSQTATILEPEILRKVVIPRIKTLFSYIKKRFPHVSIFMHSCGAIRSLIPDLISAGMDILNPVQFTASGMELAGLKKDFGDVITFWGGGVDTQSTLNNGTPGQVKDEVKRIIEIMAPGGGFVFAPVHNIQNDVPPENFWAMWDTLQEYDSDYCDYFADQGKIGL